MRKFLLNLCYIGVLTSITYLLFDNVPFNYSFERSIDPVFAFYSELIFILAGWILFFVFINHITVILIGLLAGQISLYFINSNFAILGYEIPYYGLPAINGFLLLLLYFIFSADKWAPEEIKMEDFDT